MKKIFTLALSLVVLSFSFAQPAYRNNRQDYNKCNGSNIDDVSNGNRPYGRGYFFTPRERDIAIADISNFYAERISDVRRGFYVFGKEKRRQIAALVAQRDDRVSSIWARYNSHKK